MKQIVYCTTGILMLFQAVVVFGQTNLFDAVYQELQKSYTLNTDGTMDYRYTKTIRLQSYNAFHRLFGETFVVYNPDYQELIIHNAYTIMADGKKIMVPKNAFNEVLPRFANHCPAFNHLREMVITHTGLEIGATIYLDYTIHTQKGFFPALMGTESLAESQPVTNLSVTVTIPDDQSLHYHLFNSNEKPILLRQNGATSYRWHRESIPAVTQERFSGKNGENIPVLIFSTDKGYNNLAAFYGKQEAFSFELSPEMEKRVNRSDGSGTTKKEEIFGWQEMVVKELNLYSIPDCYTGYRLRPLQDVWKSNGGTPAEKAVLLTALLRKSGVNAMPAIVMEPRLFDQQIGNLTTISTWVVQVPLPKMGKIYLAVDQINAFDKAVLSPNQTILVFQDDNTFSVISSEAPKSTIHLNGSLVLSDSLLLTGSLTGEVAGQANPVLALMRDESKLKYYFSGGLHPGEIRDVMITELSLEKTTFSAEVKKEPEVTSDIGYLTFEFPVMKGGSEQTGIHYLESTRHTPLELSSAMEESYSFTLAFPDHITLLSEEKEIKTTNQAGSFSFIVLRKGNLVHVKRSLHIPHATIEPGHYSAFKALMDQWNLYQNRIVLFRQ
ncbi:MAG: DUF3857 domain-containing protein [Bacteroidales bacterium]|nr:DUF3857 domain-containing protein [Bacteroidales bacterium]